MVSIYASEYWFQVDVNGIITDWGLPVLVLLWEIGLY